MKEKKNKTPRAIHLVPGVHLSRCYQKKSIGLKGIGCKIDIVTTATSRYQYEGIESVPVRHFQVLHIARKIFEPKQIELAACVAFGCSERFDGIMGDFLRYLFHSK